MAIIVSEVLIGLMGKSLAKFLLQKFLEGAGPAEQFGDELVDLAANKIQGLADRRHAQRVFESIADQIIQHISPLFESAIKREEISVEAVARELGMTLGGKVSEELLLANDLDPARLTRAFRNARPLPSAQLSEAETALYDRALEQAVRYIVDVAARLPRFDSKSVALQLQRLRHMQSDIERALESIGRVESTIASSSLESKFARFEADYRQSVCRNVDFLALFGADIEQQSRRYKLSVAYISLNLQSGEDEEEFDEDRQGLLFPAEVVFDQLSAETGRLLIRGDAGSGKSTLFQWAAMSAASVVLSESDRFVSVLERGNGVQEPVARIGASGNGWRERVPVLIRLRDCKDGKLPPIEEFTLQTAKELGRPPDGWLKSILDGGRALLLVDGVDEVPNRDRHVVFEEIERLVRTYPSCYYILSTRPTAVVKDWLKPLGFQEARINPLSSADRDLLIERWHAAVAHELECIGKPAEELPALADALKAELRQNPPISRLATNPLLAAMICALHRERNQKLPETQAELCEALCHMLLERREKESRLDLSGFPEIYRSLTYRQKRQIVSEIARRMVLNERSVLDREQALQEVSRILGFVQGRADGDASPVLDALVERSGMLREARPGFIEFIHNTFKEYLAAGRFSEERDDGLLAKNALDPSWQQVVVFAAAMGEQRFVEGLLRSVIGERKSSGASESKKRGSKFSDEQRSRLLMAVRMGSVAQLLDKGLRELIDDVQRDLFPPRTMSEAEALASAGDVVVPFLRYRKKDPARTVAACVRTLGQIASPVARACMRHYMGDDRWTVVLELMQHVEPLELGYVRKHLLNAGKLPYYVSRRISDLKELVDIVHGSGLSDLDLSGTHGVKDLGPLSVLTSLQGLSLRGSGVTDLVPISSLTALRSLDLSGTRIAGLGPLAGLAVLRVLLLNRVSGITDLAPLSKLKSLQELSLVRADVTDLAPLADLTELEALHLDGTGVADLGALAGLNGLKALSLSDSKVTDLAPLAGLTELQALHLDGTGVTNLESLAGLTGLRALSLSNTKVADLAPLAGLSELRALSLDNTAVTDLGSLASLKKLRVLSLFNTKIADLSPLAGLSDILNLDLGATDVTNLEPLSGLVVLQDIFLHKTGVKELRALSGMSDLKLIVLPEAVGDLSPLYELPRLEFVWTTGAPVAWNGPRPVKMRNGSSVVGMFRNRMSMRFDRMFEVERAERV